MNPYQTFAKEGTSCVEIKKSEFLGYAAHVKTEEEARNFLERIRKKHADARHHVYAYLLSENNTMRYSDDGEPQGTGGLPVLDILRKREISDGILVVVRYFGGILLGTGGLTRAYGGAAASAADDAGIARFTRYDVVRFHVNYTVFQRLSSFLRNFSVLRDGEEYGEDVTVTLAVAAGETSRFLKALQELGAGSIRPEIVGERLDRER